MKKTIKLFIPSAIFLIYVLTYKFIIFPVDFEMPLRSIVAIFFTLPIAILYFIWTPIMVSIGFTQGGSGWGSNLLDFRAQAIITVFYMIILYYVTFGIYSVLEKRKKANSSAMPKEQKKM